MVRLLFILSFLFCACAGGLRTYAAANEQKNHFFVEQKAADDHQCLVADDAGDDDHAVIKRNLQTFFVSHSPVVFHRNCVVYEPAPAPVKSSRSILARICVLRL